MYKDTFLALDRCAQKNKRMQLNDSQDFQFMESKATSSD